jgi:hypothetical protein
MQRRTSTIADRFGFFRVLLDSCYGARPIVIFNQRQQIVVAPKVLIYKHFIRCSVCTFCHHDIAVRLLCVDDIVLNNRIEGTDVVVIIISKRSEE